MASRAVLWVSVIGVLAGLGACGKSEGSGPLPEIELPGRLAVVVCNSAAACCRNAKLPFDNASCKRAFADQIQRDLDESSDRVSYDANAAGECLDAMAASIRCGDYRAVSPPICERIWRGTLQLGTACRSSRECTPSDFEYVSCDSDGEGSRVCQSRPRAARGDAGDACAFTCPAGEECNFAVDVGGGQPLTICYLDDGLFCDDEGVCAGLIEVGDACAASDACRAGAFCDFTARRCRALKADREPCTSDSQCQSGNCEGPDDASAPELPTDNPGETTPDRCLPSGVGSAELCREDFMD